MRLVLGTLVILSLASAASAQTEQSDLLRQMVISSESPTGAWQTVLSPQMVTTLHTMNASGPLPPNCHPVMIGDDKRPVQIAGATLHAGTACIKAPKSGLPTKEGGLAQQNLKNGIQAPPVAGITER